MRIVKYLAAICGLLVVGSALAASVQFSGGQVVGVSGLDVDGAAYNAIFHDATYNQLLLDFPAPDYVTNYSAAFAESATRALHKFAVIDGGFTGTSTDDINGCTSTTNCYLSTTVGQNSLTAWSIRFTGNATSGVPTYYPFHIYPYAVAADFTHVVWNASTVPVPATLWLFCSGIIGLLGITTKHHSRKLRAT